jgi:hypothetical protein
MANEGMGVVTSGKRLSRSYILRWLAFYLIVPIVFALHLGASESGSATFIAKRYYFLYFLAATLPLWWVMDLCTRILQSLLRPWGPPLLVILVAGSVLAMNLQAIWSPFRQSLFEPYLAEGSHFYKVFPWRYQDWDYLTEAVFAWIFGGTLWVSVNYFFLKVLKFPRFGYGVDATEDLGGSEQDDSVLVEGEQRDKVLVESADSSRAAKSVLLDQLPEKLGRNVVALKAEEHYTRVYTEEGEALILIRFRDAVGLLQHLGGIQTHRSYWVNPKYVARLTRDGRSTSVELTTGISIPLSRSYRVVAQKALQR